MEEIQEYPTSDPEPPNLEAAWELISQRKAVRSHGETKKHQPHQEAGRCANCWRPRIVAGEVLS